MIEIKHINGKVLYVAQDAKVVREAVEKAVSEGANLRGANLEGAYLGGAYLEGAYLGGAYLEGAYLGGALWKQVAVLLRSAILSMNDSGRHWIKGAERRATEDGSLAYCSIGGVKAQESDGTTLAIALWLLGSVCAGDITRFNDDPATTWEDVQAVFAVAIRHAERLGAA